MSTVTSLWQEAEQRQRGKIALVAGDVRLSYAELGARIRGLASSLHSRWGVGAGDVVALLCWNRAEFVVSYFAITALGATVQPIDERLSADEVRAVLEDSAAEILIVDHQFWPRVAMEREKLPRLRHVLGVDFADDGIASFSAWAIGNEDAAPAMEVSSDTIAELMYTSGTTGEPKGVMRSHRNVRAASRNAIRGFGYKGSDVIAIVMPLSHSSALNSQMLPILELGGTLVLLPRFEPSSLLETIKVERVSCMRAVPAMLRLLLALPEFGADELPTLRLIINSSAAIDPQTYADVKRRFATVEVMNSYGLTEASTCTVLPDTEAFRRSDSIGVPIAGVEMRVVNANEAVPDGEEGELCVRGDHVFVGYRGRGPEARHVDVEGWLHTGDLGHRDADGFYFLHGRVDDVINCGGRKVVPLDVENCILQLPQVADVAVVGSSHRVLGEVVKAFVVPRADVALDRRDVIRHCTRNLASHKVPFVVEMVPALPKNSVGKTLRRKLRERSA